VLSVKFSESLNFSLESSEVTEIPHKYPDTPDRIILSVINFQFRLFTFSSQH
jgi:hypothetical protein